MAVPQVQLNIVTVVDVDKALAAGTLERNIYMMDNSPNIAGLHSDGQGTDHLSTNCSPGQVLNWIIYPIVTLGSARISDIAFVAGDVCVKLQVYGAPDIPLSPRYLPGITPVYDYWAGLVSPTLAEGRYRYSLEVQMGTTLMRIDTPSLNVMSS